MRMVTAGLLLSAFIGSGPTLAQGGSARFTVMAEHEEAEEFQIDPDEDGSPLGGDARQRLDELRDWLEQRNRQRQEAGIGLDEPPEQSGEADAAIPEEPPPHTDFTERRFEQSWSGKREWHGRHWKKGTRHKRVKHHAGRSKKAGKSFGTAARHTAGAKNRMTHGRSGKKAGAAQHRTAGASKGIAQRRTAAVSKGTARRGTARAAPAKRAGPARRSGRH